MARNPRIRIRDDDRKLYSKLARNVSAKISRIKKNFGIDHEEMRLPSLENIQTRDQFNEVIERAQSFTNRHNQKFQYHKNEYGVVYTQSEKTLHELAENRAIRLAIEQKRKYDKLPIYQRGKKQDVTVGQMSALMDNPSLSGINIPEKTDFSKVTTRYNLEYAMRRAKARGDRAHYDERKERMKDNFISILELSFNSLADELVEEIRRIPSEDFYEMYLSFDEFEFERYDSEGQNVDADEGTINQMMQYVNWYKRGDLNIKYKSFD